MIVKTDLKTELFFQRDDGDLGLLDTCNGVTSTEKLGSMRRHPITLSFTCESMDAAHFMMMSRRQYRWMCLGLSDGDTRPLVRGNGLSPKIPNGRTFFEFGARVVRFVTPEPLDDWRAKLIHAVLQLPKQSSVVPHWKR